MTTIKELIAYLDIHKEKIFEISFGGYWIQVPFGLIGDIVKKIIDYVIIDEILGEQE